MRKDTTINVYTISLSPKLRAHTYHTVVLLATPSLTLTLTLWGACWPCRLRPKKWKRVQLRSVRAPRAAAALRLWLRRAPLLSRARAASRSRLGAPPPEGEQHTSPPESRSSDESTSATPCVQDETKRKKQKTGDRAARRSGARARLQRVHLEHLYIWRVRSVAFSALAPDFPSTEI